MPLLLVLFLGVVMLKRETKTGPSRVELEALAARIARAEGLPDAVPFLALIDIESAWDHQAKNCAGGDGQRGCAWGLPQITLQTAYEMDERKPTRWRENDPARQGAALLQHPEIALTLGARYFQGAYLIAKSENPGALWSDAAARYNAGWGRGLRAAPRSTLETYVPRFERALNRRRGAV